MVTVDLYRALSYTLRAKGKIIPDVMRSGRWLDRLRQKACRAAVGKLLGKLARDLQWHGLCL